MSIKTNHPELPDIAANVIVARFRVDRVINEDGRDARGRFAKRLVLLKCVHAGEKGEYGIVMDYGIGMAFMEGETKHP